MAVGAAYSVATDLALTTSSTAFNITTNVAVAAGDTLFVGVANRLGAAAAISTLSIAVDEIVGKKSTSTTIGVSLARCNLSGAGLASGTAITGTLDNSSSRKVVFAFAVPGLKNANVDQSGTGEGSSGAPGASTSSAQSLADAIAIFISSRGGTATTNTTTAGTGYTKRADKVAGSSSWIEGFAEYKVLSATGTQTATSTPIDTTHAWSGYIGVWIGTASNQTVSPPAATASASSLVPTVTAAGGNQTVSPPVATASASGLVPTVSTSGGATGLQNNAEGGSNGTTVTTGNSGGASGNAWTTVSGAPTFSSTQAAHGSLSYSLITSGAVLQWGQTADADGYGRAYVYLTSGAGVRVLGQLSGVDKWHIDFGTTSFVITNGSFTTEATGTAPSANQWYRVEWHHNSASQLEVKVWNSMDSSGTPDQDLTAAASTNGNVDVIAFFRVAAVQFYIDDLNGFATAWPGPVGGTGNQTVSPVAATASASAPIPTIAIGIAPAAATASASSATPIPKLGISPAKATAAASSLVPVPQLRVSPAAATASASAPVPAIGVTIAGAQYPVYCRTVHDSGGFDQPNGYTDAQDGQLYGVIITNYRDRSHVAALKSQNPNLKVFCYFDPIVSDSTDTGGDNSGVDYSIANNGSNNSWFLLHSGSRIVHTGQATAWQMDMGLQAYQDACVANMLAHLQDGTDWDGVFLDEIGVNFTYCAFSATPDLYATETDWQAALTSYFTRVVPQMHAAGYKVIPNLSDDYNTSDTSVSDGIIALCDGYNEESWTDGGAGLAQQNAWTPFRMTVVANTEAAGKLVCLHSHNTTEAGQTYALALGLILQQGHTHHERAWPNYQSEAIIPEYTTAFGLLNPTAAYTTLASGVYKRTYQGGVVFANTTGSSSGPYSLGGDYYGSGLGDVTSVTLAAYSGLVLQPVMASASALVPTVTAGSSNQTVSPPAATASASAPAPTIQLRVSPAAASASASSPIAGVSLRVSPAAATASASGLVPVPQLRVSPAAASASASSPVPTVGATTLVSPPAATASVSAPVPGVQLQIPAPVAAASASGLVPVVTSAPVVSPPAATASASSLVPVPQLRVSPAAATASASGLAPGVFAGQTVAPPAATASASAPVPAIQVRVLAPLASASASGPVPTVTSAVLVLPPAATASASALIPAVKLQIAAVLATASASSPLPAFGVTVVLPAAAGASASAKLPALQLNINAPSATAAASVFAPFVFLGALVVVTAPFRSNPQPGVSDSASGTGFRDSPLIGASSSPTMTIVATDDLLPGPGQIPTPDLLPY